MRFPFSALGRTWLAHGLAALCLTACAVPNAQLAETAPPTRPKLVVFLVVDGLPQRQVLAYRDQLASDGFARFLDRGAWFANAHYAHGYTVTGAGHATMLTGAYPDRTGIIGNDWRDANTGAPVYCTSDETATYIGHKTQALDGTSPRNLKVPTVGDVLRSADPRAKVLAVSGKDRGAILPAGQRGMAYMYMHASGQFASSTYYMKEHPAWVQAFNGAKPADRYFKTEWTALLPAAAYARSLPDGQSFYPRDSAGLPLSYRAPEDEAPGLRFYSELLRGPFVDALTLDFARAAIAGEQLGQDEVPDILAISLSGHDYVNHAYSAESRFSHDHFLQLDRLLQSFFRDLDATVGAGNYVAVLTADHGFMPAPETLSAQGLKAGRVNLGQAVAKVNERLASRFGSGRWVMGTSAASLLLDKALIAQKGVNLDEVAEAAREALLAQEGIGAAFTRKELLSGSRQGAPFFDSLRKAWHPQVSGEVQFALQANYMPGTAGATHGSPHAYDTQVPILLYGPRWVKPGRVDEAVEVVDIAPTLARWMAVSAPAASQGRVLPQAVR